jgi:hypothetical protein
VEAFVEGICAQETGLRLERETYFAGDHHECLVQILSKLSAPPVSTSTSNPPDEGSLPSCSFVLTVDLLWNQIPCSETLCKTQAYC